jgi:hypothetical protein
MTMTKYVPPKYRERSFHCPQCGVLAAQHWHSTTLLLSMTNNSYQTVGQVFGMDRLALARCEHCNQYSIWRNKQMLFPDGGNASLPHSEMPEDVRADYNEARGIVGKTPRGAAALLRLAIQRLMPHLGEKGKDLNTDIANLVQKGLPIRIQQALDSVRVIGNEAVHPGQLEVNDTPEIAQGLFNLVNIIVDKMIAEPRMIESLYGTLPASKLAAIEKRDIK